MIELQSGDQIEVFYEDDPATTIRATVARLLSDREEGMGVEVEDYCACWIEIDVEEPGDMDAKLAGGIAWHGFSVSVKRPPDKSS